MATANGTAGICPASSSQRNYVPSPRRDAAKQRLRKWKRNRKRWATQPRFNGGRFVELVEGARARPYELGDLRHALLEVMGDREILAFEYLVAVTKGFGGCPGGLHISHAQTGKLLDCAPRTAQDAMHHLVKLGLVEQRPGFRLRSVEERATVEPVATVRVVIGALARGPKHYELASTWAVTPRGLELASWSRRSSLVGKKNQPGRVQRTLRVHSSGVPGRGRRVRAFVASVLDNEKAPIARPGVATVIERLPDGRVALGSELTADKVAKRLTREEPEPGTPEWAAAATAAAWRSFEAREAGR